MKLLLDTHALVWTLLQVERLSKVAREAIADGNSEAYVSVASIWEIAIKAGLGKWPEAGPMLADIDNNLSRANIGLLPITVAHVRTAGLMTAAHRDPFDRLLAAQATLDGMTLITADTRMAGLGAITLW